VRAGAKRTTTIRAGLLGLSSQITADVTGFDSPFQSKSKLTESITSCQYKTKDFRDPFSFKNISPHWYKLQANNETEKC
jgi:hypothetical protein